LSKFEKNKIENPSKMIIALVANGISADWFFGDSGPITTVSLMGSLANIKKTGPNSPVAKHIKDYVKRHPEVARAQKEAVEKGLI